MAAASEVASHAGSSLPSLPLAPLAHPASRHSGSLTRKVALKAFGRVIKTLPEGNLHFSPLPVCAANMKAVNGGRIAAGGAASVLILDFGCFAFRFVGRLPLPTVNVRGDGSVAVWEAAESGERGKLNTKPVVA